MFLILLPDALPLFIFPLFIYGVGHGMNIPLIQTLLAEISPIEYRGAFMSMNGMLLRLGQTLGPFIMGSVYAIQGINAVLLLAD